MATIRQRAPLFAGRGTVTATLGDTTAPSIPTGLAVASITGSTSSLRLTWSASTDTSGPVHGTVAGYRVYRASSAGGTYSLVSGASLVNALTWDDSGLSASTTYYYKLAAVDAAGNASAQSAYASGTTNAVANLPPYWDTVPALNITQGNSQSIAGYAHDPEAQTLTFLRTGGTAPVGVTVTTAGVVSVNASTAVGSYTLDVRATDPGGLYDTATCVVTVTVATGAVLQGNTFADQAIGFIYQEKPSPWVAMNLGGNCRGADSDPTDGGEDPPKPVVVAVPAGSPSWAGTKCVQYYVAPTSLTTASLRSEMDIESYGRPSTPMPAEGTEFFEGCAIRLDPAWPYTDGFGTVIMQNHRVFGQPGTSPTTYGIRIAANDYRITSEAATSGNLSVTFLPGAVQGDRGVWVAWVLHWKASTTGTGWIKIYRNGELVYNSPNYTTIPPGTTEMLYPKRGLYPAIGALPANVRALYGQWRWSDSVAGGSVALVDPRNY